MKRTLLIFGLLVVGGVAGVWWYMAAGRHPLAGSTRHDFGEVVIYGANESFEHVFHLTNRTSDVIEVLDVKPSCGCTDVVVEPERIEPGATVAIKTTLTLYRAGHKKTHTKLILGAHGIQTVWVEAVGKKDLVLWSIVDTVELAQDTPVVLSIGAARQAADLEPPGVPAVALPPGVTATFVEWVPMGERAADETEPNHWRGRFDLEWNGEKIATNAQAVIMLDQAEPIRVRIK